jgi:hypothetical protein
MAMLAISAAAIKKSIVVKLAKMSCTLIIALAIGTLSAIAPKSGPATMVGTSCAATTMLVHKLDSEISQASQITPTRCIQMQVKATLFPAQ